MFGTGGRWRVVRRSIVVFPVQAKDRDIVTQHGVVIAVASDAEMSEEIVRRLNKSDWNDQEDQWAL